MFRPRGAPVAVAALVAVLLTVVLVPIAGAHGHPRKARVHLSLSSGPLPSSPRVGDVVRIAGLVRAPGRSVVELQGRTQGSPPGPWRAYARRALAGGGGRFQLRWTVPKALGFHPVSLRVAVLLSGHAVAFTVPVSAIVGPAYVPCTAAPAPPAYLPPGDGWVTGGLYGEGGPAPGIDACSGDAYTIVATNAATQAQAASENVAAGQGYTIALAPGQYTLSSNECRSAGTVTVTAGHGTAADTICAFP
jgi:hypothetical protein